MELLELLKQYASFLPDCDVIGIDNRYERAEDNSFKDDIISVSFRGDNMNTEEYAFPSTEKAIEGMKGLVQFKQNVRA